MFGAGRDTSHTYIFPALYAGQGKAAEPNHSISGLCRVRSGHLEADQVLGSG